MHIRTILLAGRIVPFRINPERQRGIDVELNFTNDVTDRWSGWCPEFGTIDYKEPRKTKSRRNTFPAALFVSHEIVCVMETGASVVIQSDGDLCSALEFRL